METFIEIIQGKKETNFPVIKLTKSKNGKTGTATFLFLPFAIESSKLIYPITYISLCWQKKEITTKDISIQFKNGKPFLIKGVFLFRNAFEWFSFLEFMNFYAKERGFYFHY